MNTVSSLVASSTGLAVSAVALAIVRRDAASDLDPRTRARVPSSPSSPPSYSTWSPELRTISAPLPAAQRLICDTPRQSFDSNDSLDSSFPLAPVRYPSLAELKKPIPASQQTSLMSRTDMIKVSSLMPAGARSSGVAESAEETTDQDALAVPRRRQLTRSITSSSIARLTRPGLSNRPASMILPMEHNKIDSNAPAYSAGLQRSLVRVPVESMSSDRPRYTSRLPIPSLRKISWGRSQQQQQTTSVLTASIESSRAPGAERLSPTTEGREQARWRNFFTPRVIPEGGRRVRPDLRHRPILLSAAEDILPSQIAHASSSAIVPTEYRNKRHSSAPLSLQSESRSPLSLNSSQESNKIPSRTRSQRRHTQTYSPEKDQPGRETDNFAGSAMAGDAARSKRSSLIFSLRQISQKRVSSAPSCENKGKAGVAVERGLPQLAIRSKPRSDAHALNPPKRRDRIARMSYPDTAFQKSVIRPSSASTMASSLREFSHTPTIDSILSPSRPGSSIDQNCESVHERAFEPLRDFRSFSDVASSAAESDMDVASQYDDFGFSEAGDAMYDSVRTRATSTSSALRASDIDKIFEAPASNESEDTPTQEYGQRWLLDKTRSSIIEEEESNASTPVRRPAGLVLDPDSCLSLRPSRSQVDVEEAFPDFGASDWDVPDRNEDDGGHAALVEFRSLANPDKSRLRLSTCSDAKNSIFDWAEQAPPDSAASTGFARPKTVHGKKNPLDARGGRTSGRRIAAGIHARSQSVPVAPEVKGKRTQGVTAKFGTWGVGSKGVTEDWNEDFDFDFGPATVSGSAVPEAQVEEPTRLDSATVMIIPDLIKEQQSSVLANIGLLREWGLLIEELKELKARATTINLLSAHVSTSAMWNEVDAMIDLADHESQDQTLAPSQSSPSSPDFGAAAFNEPVPDDLVLLARPLGGDDAMESPSSSPVKSTARITGRPRKDSEAVARSVIEALQQRRNVSDPTTSTATIAPPSKKVPFDTATLRRIVPHVQDLRDRVKRTIRQAEGLYDSPSPKHGFEHSDAGSGRMFDVGRSSNGSPHASPVARKRSATPSVVNPGRSKDDEDGSLCGSHERLDSRMGIMTAV